MCSKLMFGCLIIMGLSFVNGMMLFGWPLTLRQLRCVLEGNGIFLGSQELKNLMDCLNLANSEKECLDCLQQAIPTIQIGAINNVQISYIMECYYCNPEDVPRPLINCLLAPVIQDDIVVSKIYDSLQDGNRPMIALNAVLGPNFNIPLDLKLICEALYCYIRSIGGIKG